MGRRSNEWAGNSLSANGEEEEEDLLAVMEASPTLSPQQASLRPSNLTCSFYPKLTAEDAFARVREGKDALRDEDGRAGKTLQGEREQRG